jgi:AcrR family transcriptional regulator
MTASPTRRKRGSGHELREIIIQVATDLLARLGDVDALTMRAVSTAAGVTAPAVYRHFPDKETLVGTIIAERFAQFTAELWSAGEAAADQLAARLRAIAHAYVRSGLEHPGHYRVLFSSTNAGPGGLGLKRDAEHPGAASHRELVEAVAACLPPADRDGSAALLATELWASLHGIVDLRITKPEMPWPDWRTLVDTALVAVRTAAGDGRPGG